MTSAFRQGFMDKLAAIKSPEDLDAFYKKLKYRVLNKDTNRPYFNTNFETFDKWHLLSPEQIKKHKIGICYDTAAMTDKVLKALGVEHRNYFARSDKDDGWENDPTHAFNVYKDENGDWRWLEGSWEPYKGNNWKERRRKDLVKKIVKALAEASGKKQKLHEVAEFPEPGIAMKDWEDEMLKNPVKRAELEKKASSLDLKKLFPNSKFPTEDELKEKEKSFSVGDRVKVSDHIRCRQKGHVGTIVRIDPENKHGWKSFVVEFDDKKCGSMGFSSGNIDKVVEKKASSKNETYESGEGEVETYTPDKTDGHDEIVLRLKNGKKIVISNNTRIGIRVIPAEGDHIGYNGYRINGTNVVHKVHGNRHQRGGWLEHSAGF